MDEKWLKLAQEALASDPEAMKRIAEWFTIHYPNGPRTYDELAQSWGQPPRVDPSDTRIRSDPFRDAMASVSDAVKGWGGGTAERGNPLGPGFKNLSWLASDVNNRMSAVSGVGDMMGTAMIKAGSQYGDPNQGFTQMLRYLNGMQGINDWQVPG